jgi:epoxyqueuosine reductase QueG
MGVSKPPSGYTHKLKLTIQDWGADLVGVADTEPLKAWNTTPANLLDPFPRAVAIAVQIPIYVFETLVDRPTPIYSAVYQTANRMLDEIAFRTARNLQEKGFASLPIPASQVVDKNTWRGAISHKAVARLAGLGWQGKNLLLITPAYGSRVRLVTVLTDAPLESDSPIKNRCGSCMLCRDACPVDAIKGKSTKTHYKNRNEALFFSRCVKKLTEEFAQRPGIGSPICGICIKVCPFGRYRKNQRADPKHS